MDLTNREIYDKTYSDENLKINPRTEYDKKLVELRFSLIKEYGTGKDVVDLCCGTGSYLIPTHMLFKSVVGIDFSSNMLSLLRKKFNDQLPEKVTLLENDAADISLENESVDFVFSYTSLYYVEKLAKALHEIWRVLRPGGTAVLEFGNRYSLNKLVSDAMHKRAGWAKLHVGPLWETTRYIGESKFRIIKSYSFQLLPMYMGPRSLFFLYPFMSEPCKKLLGITISGKMLDEWISSSWPLKYFAFRHIFVLSK